MNPNPIRVFIRRLRALRGITQPQMAEVLDKALRTYSQWESRGIGSNPTTTQLLDALTFLGAPQNLATWLPSASESEAEQMADKVYAGMNLQDDIGIIASAAVTNPDALDAVLDELRDVAQHDEGLLNYLRGLVAGARLRRR